MTIQNLFSRVTTVCPIPEALAAAPVRDVTADSRAVQPGTVFFCLAGTKADGHDFAAAALQQGAAAVVTERPLGLEKEITVPGTRKAFALCCARWFGDPSEQLKMIAVTGTNGKTTTTYLLKQMLEKTGYKVGLIGTIQNMIGDRILPTERTTPESFELQGLFAEMAEAGCTHVVMEVSSHALYLHRVDCIPFAVRLQRLQHRRRAGGSDGPGGRLLVPDLLGQGRGGGPYRLGYRAGRGPRELHRDL